MRTILITGLDGSGKSTVFRRLSACLPIEGIDILLLPHFEEESLQGDQLLQRIARMINTLNSEADTRALPQLKAVALFSAMLLFEKVLAHKAVSGVHTVYCERHPLIDTGVYARFYAEKLRPGALPVSVMTEMDQRFPLELDFIYSVLPGMPRHYGEGPTSAFAEFIYKWFHEEKRYGLDQLQALFGSILPERIYYLKADADILFERLGNRSVREAHERIDVLERLGLAYDRLLAGIPVPVETVDANHFEELDAFIETLLKDFQ